MTWREGIWLLLACLLFVAAIFYLAPRSDIVETRLVKAERLEVFSAPKGEALKLDEPIGEGELVYVLEREGEWLRFRTTEKDFGWSAWAPVSLTTLDVGGEAAAGRSKLAGGEKVDVPDRPY